jgi:hypothetical protein
MPGAAKFGVMLFGKDFAGTGFEISLQPASARFI